MVVLQGRILITDYSIKGNIISNVLWTNHQHTYGRSIKKLPNQMNRLSKNSLTPIEERDAVIENILNHKSSRAALYVMLMDFKDIPTLLRKFPTILPFVLDPKKDVQETLKYLKTLPHMDHFINFLGQEVAIEFLGRRKNFRIKDVSIGYAAENAVDKMLKSNGQGIIFNVHPDDFVGEVIQSVENIFSSNKRTTGQSSADENATFFRNQGKRKGNRNRRSAKPNVFWRFFISLYYLCPCVNGMNVILPVERYPPDLDAKMMEAFQEMHNELGAKWLLKVDEARRNKAKGLAKIANEKEKLVKKESNRLSKEKMDLSGTTSDPVLSRSISESQEKTYVATARLNVHSAMTDKKKEIYEHYPEVLQELYNSHYDIIIAEQIKTLISVWKRANGFFF